MLAASPELIARPAGNQATLLNKDIEAQVNYMHP